MDWGQIKWRYRWIRMITDLCVADDRAWTRFRWRKETKIIYRVDCDGEDVSDRVGYNEGVCRLTVRVLASGVLAARGTTLVRAGLSGLGLVRKVVRRIGRTVRLGTGRQNGRERDQSKETKAKG